uniref:Uncharacterized protein n=1 Tax=Brassica oleracea TaxID=3712 RepID=A0A3P6GJF2_BRAOL|nr:unnamed protein product [Brassica oleracea]
MVLDISLPSGDIKKVELEYEKLEKHCFSCHSRHMRRMTVPTPGLLIEEMTTRASVNLVLWIDLMPLSVLKMIGKWREGTPQPLLFETSMKKQMEITPLLDMITMAKTIIETQLSPRTLVVTTSTEVLEGLSSGTELQLRELPSMKLALRPQNMETANA